MRRLVLLLCLAGCPQPIKPPVPPTPVTDAAPADQFDGKIVTCGGATRAQTVEALSPVTTCLVIATPPDSCLVSLLTSWSVDAVACAVRSVGMTAFAAVADGTASDAVKIEAAESRAWIRAKAIGYKD
ncbi:MAG TPA: hypothetical protein VJ801_17590 [Polyangia bacterium]|jgi:hypothetical protein|nr:hypothetical protein [Polyangia bacterium]